MRFSQYLTAWLGAGYVLLKFLERMNGIMSEEEVLPAWGTELNFKQGARGDVPWFIIRTDLGALCGYVAIHDKHRWYGKSTGEWDDIKDTYVSTALDSVDVHGGITWAGWAPTTLRELLGESFHNWWFIGFDCSHAWDYVPAINMPGGTYRDMAYVQEECEELADQVIKACC